MAYLTEARKRDFVKQLIVLTENSSELLNDAGYNPTNLIGNLKNKSTEADLAEEKQLEAAVQAKEATKNAQEKLLDAYKEASKTVDLFSGLLGKDHTLVKQIRKMRK